MEVVEVGKGLAGLSWATCWSCGRASCWNRPLLKMLSWALTQLKLRMELLGLRLSSIWLMERICSKSLATMVASLPPARVRFEKAV